MRLVISACAPALAVAAYFAAACNTGEVSSPSVPANRVSAGSSSDAALQDSAPPEGGSTSDAGSDDAALDASDAACPPAFAGCGSDAAPPFFDQTAEDAGRVVTFQTTTTTPPRYEYTPKCLRIKTGQTVTFTGDFYIHPLAPACGPSAALENRTDAGISSSTFTLSAPGAYGYYCLDHGNTQGASMSGVIDVVP